MYNFSVPKSLVVFIVNPVAGGKDKKHFAQWLKRGVDKRRWHVCMHTTHAVGEAKYFAEQALANGADRVVAVGGDGTVNEVAQVLAHTPTALGVVAWGSGNGLARHFRLPLDPRQALLRVMQGNVRYIDAGSINGKLFLCTTGIGFDAAVSARFAQYQVRGFHTYVRSTIEVFWRYEPETLELDWGEGRQARRVFSVTIANITQYGNNAYIAPMASAEDGWLDLCLLHPFAKWMMPKVAVSLFSKRLPQCSFYEHHRVQQLSIHGEGPLALHLDGENYVFGTELFIKVVPRCIKLLV